MPTNPFIGNVNFQKGNGGLGGQGTGSDYISGLLYYDINSGYTPSAKYFTCLSAADAIVNGFGNTYADETPAQYSTTLSKGNTGDVISIYMVNPLGVTILLCTYTQLSGDSTDTLLATNIASLINANLLGFSATHSTGTLIITMPTGWGVYPNASPTTNLTSTITGTITFGTVTCSTSGIASIQAQVYYQISEYFRLNPTGQLYFGYIKAASSTLAFSEINTLQSTANGAVRQVGIFGGVPNSILTTGTLVASTLVTYANTINAVCASLETMKQPLSALLAINCYELSDPTLLTNLNTLADNFVSVIMGQDGNGAGNYLFLTTLMSAPCLGCALGCLSAAYVNQSIAQTSEFNLSNGIEMSAPAYANGVLYAMNDTTAGLLDSYGYIFAGMFPDTAGTFFNDSYTACPKTNDYSYIELNRVIDKAIRLLNSTFVLNLKMPLLLNSDGTLQAKDVAYINGLTIDALAPMTSPGAGRTPEISGQVTTVNPSQNILATGTLTVGIQITPDAIARTFTIPIQYTSN